MKFDRTDLNAQVYALCSAAEVAQRALGDNIRFEEHVSDERRQAFETRSGQPPHVRAALAEHFSKAVQGFVRDHIPETFQVINARAHMSSSIERNQRIIRVAIVALTVDTAPVPLLRGSWPAR
jgi:hypothetical protein